MEWERDRLSIIVNFVFRVPYQKNGTILSAAAAKATTAHRILRTVRKCRQFTYCTDVVQVGKNNAHPCCHNDSILYSI